MITVMMMFIVGEALVQSGVVRNVSRHLVRMAGPGPRESTRCSCCWLAPSPLLSPIPQPWRCLMPIAIQLSKRFKFSPSKILFPSPTHRSMAAPVRCLGTSTNLLVSAMAADRSRSRVFDSRIRLAGIPLLIVGTLYNLFIVRRLLPSRIDHHQPDSQISPGVVSDRGQADADISARRPYGSR